MKKQVLGLLFVGVAVFLCFFNTCQVQASTKEKILYFTFDDGPSERYTPRILDILKKEHVKATFFVLGFRSEQFPKLVRRISSEGHEIGNHGYYHEHILSKSNKWVVSDINKADAAIYKASGHTPVYYRPPGGIINQREVAAIRKSGHPVVIWTVDSRDWKTNSASTIANNVISNLRPGAIILFHDGVSNSRYTVEALPVIIRQCRLRGYILKVLPV